MNFIGEIRLKKEAEFLNPIFKKHKERPMFGDIFSHKEILEDDLNLEDLFSDGQMVTQIKYQRDDILSKYFTREKMLTMLKYITEMPEEDATRQRQHSIPFHTDTFFRYNHKVINDMFFTCESQNKDNDSEDSDNEDTTKK